MTKRILVLTAIILSIFAVIGFFAPTDFSIHSKIIIKAPIEVVHDHISDLSIWEDWGAWKEMNPSLDFKIGPRSIGTEASISWTGNSEIGHLKVHTSSEEDGMKYIVEINGENLVMDGHVTYKDISDEETILTKVVWTLDGKVNITVAGGYLVRFYKSWNKEAQERSLKKLKEVIEQKE